MPYFQSPLIDTSAVITDAKKVLSMIIWSKELHERVRRKLFWTKFTGRPTTGEGDIETPVTGSPIIEYSEFNRNRGDQIIIPIEFNLSENPRTDGTVGAEILTGTEEGLKYGHFKLFIEQWRRAVAVENTSMQQQRTNVPLVERAVSKLETSCVSLLDNEVFHTFFWGYSANLQRSADITKGNLSSSPVAPTAHPNTYYYIGSNKPSLVSLSQAVNDYGFSTTGVIYPKPNKDVANFWGVDLNLFDELYALLRALEIPPYQITSGMEAYIVVMHPYTATLLRSNEKWFNAMTLGLPRGVDNPVFTGSVGYWNNFLFYTSNKVPLYYPLNLTQTTVPFSTNATFYQIFQDNRDYIKLNLTTLDASGWVSGASPSGGNYYEGNTQVFDDSEFGTKWVIAPILVLGANAIAEAYSRIGPKGYQSYFALIPSERNDYGNFEAYGTRVVYGMGRIDWIRYDNTIFNQSSMLVFVGQRIYAGFIPPEFSVTV